LELRISKRNQARLLALGASKERDPHFRWMVLFHTGILLSSAAEVIVFRRPFALWLAIPSGVLFMVANAARWWVIHSLREHWNVEVMNSTSIGVIVSGPFRWVRHPNYTAVFVEMIVLPLIHTAWFTALAGALLHIYVLRNRLRIEDAALMGNAHYRELMGGKPKFLPGWYD